MKLVLSLILLFVGAYLGKINYEKITKQLSKNVVLEGIYDADEPEWVFNLACKYDKEIIFKADSLNEFEFKEWTKVKEIDNQKCQIFIEQNDRPLLNKIILLDVFKGKLLRQQVIPRFEKPPHDFDNDGLKEYAGIIDAPEPIRENYISYTPILFYEDKLNGFTLDSTATKLINTRLWGKFYGFQPNSKLVLKTPKDFYKYF